MSGKREEKAFYVNWIGQTIVNLDMLVRSPRFRETVSKVRDRIAESPGGIKVVKRKS